jgi:hypothetical protein
MGTLKDVTGCENNTQSESIIPSKIQGEQQGEHNKGALKVQHNKPCIKAILLC